MSLGAITLAYYVFGLHAYERILHVGHEYVSFIVLIGSLYVVSGGIHINVKGEATPLSNTLFLLLGALLANLLGTTGASMLLIRPWIRMNKYRITALPHRLLHLHRLERGRVPDAGGRPAAVPGVSRKAFRSGGWRSIAGRCGRWGWVSCWRCSTSSTRPTTGGRPGKFGRGWPKLPSNGASTACGTSPVWRSSSARCFLSRPVFAREVLMVGAAVGSWFTTKKQVHEANQFDFHPIQEVAILFVGIFATMMPALDWLQGNAARMGQPSPALFYWGSGVLSSVLDNAPTYLSFLSAAFGLFVDPEIIEKVQLLVQNHGADLANLTGPHAEAIRHTFAALQKYHAATLASGKVGTEEIEVAFLLGNTAFNHYILAISIGAVFFGANTYIGNGPNFMVKIIADQQKVHTPGFVGFVFKYTLPCMGPMLILIWLLFFRG